MYQHTVNEKFHVAEKPRDSVLFENSNALIVYDD